MNRMPICNKISDKDNFGFATMTWGALTLGAVAAALEWSQGSAAMQLLAEAAQTAARLLA